MRASPPLDRTLVGSSGLLRSVVSDRPRALPGRSGAESNHRPPEVEVRVVLPWSRSPPESSRLPGRPALSRREPAPARFRAPSTTSPGLAPCATGHPPPAAVPLSGSLSLPAVCQHTRASRPCFMPQTVRGVLPSERCSSLRIAGPSRGSLAPLRFSVAVPEVRCAWPRPPGFTPLARPAPGSPGLPLELARRFRQAGAWLPRRAGPRSPGPPRSCGFVRFEAFLPARVRAPERRSPGAHEPLLSWVSALQSFEPIRASGSRDPTNHSVRRGASAASSWGASPRRQVKSLRPRSRVDLVDASMRRATAHRRAPPHGGVPASLDLGDPAV